MRISQALLALTLFSVALCTHCGPGGVPCPSGLCHYPAYIEGCFIYQSSDTCYECEYSNSLLR